MSELEFTGERVVPGKVDDRLWAEHISRYDFVAPWVGGRRVLDFGCGAGYGAERLRRAGARSVVGCDLAPEAAGHARSHYGDSATFVVGDCQRAPFATGSFDVVVSFEALEHVPEPERYLDEARRLLVEDGLFFVSTPNKRTYTDESEAEKNPYHIKEFYFDELLEVLNHRFGTVRPFGQWMAEGVFFGRLGGEGGETVQRLVAEGLETFDPERVEYFVVLCAVGEEDARLATPSHAFRPGGGSEVAALRNDLMHLRQEFEERTAWALDLDRQLSESASRILERQAEVERNVEWALSLDVRRQELESLVAELEQRLAQREERVRELETRLGEDPSIARD